jgi:AcrR family transcriptional regulator
MEMEMGLRERKKEQTRQLIAETAWRLFADRGFEQVTVAEVARQAQVAVATVFNYFPAKEDLFYYRLEAFGARLVDAVSARTEGEPVLVAFKRHLLESGGLLAQVEAGDPQALERLRTINRVIAASPALLAREQRALARTADALAALLAAETDAPARDLGPQVAANALIGVQRAARLHPPTGPGRRGARPAGRRRPPARPARVRAAGARPRRLHPQASPPNPRSNSNPQPQEHESRRRPVSEE